ncbi:MAG: hypothetical protein JW793_11095, partial [Acidobacteria bacterium]|nr:hypothetical protein [Acidobacteriota bacterium]
AMEAEPEVEVEPAEEAAEPAIPAEAALVEEKEPEPIIEAEPEEEAHPETPDVVEPVEVAAETAIPDESKEFEAALGALSAAGPEEAQEKEPAAPPKAAGTAEAASEAEPREARPEGDEEKLHADAKRFARLLVSEIKLYNETAVSEGRENNDLYIRLKRDIDKSREMYDKRVSPAVSQKMDYFHDEIVRILGGNDPSKLGSDYPGGRI